VIDVQYHGATSRWQVRTEDGSVLAVVRPELGEHGNSYAVGSRVRIIWPREQMVMLEGH